MDRTTISAWKALTPTVVEFHSLDKDIQVDVAIVGGGITGITAAHELIKKNKKVAILESLQIGNGTTGFSTGNLYLAIQPYFQTILKKFNEETVINVIHSRAFAINYIKNVVNQYKLECHFSLRPWYLFTNQEKNISVLEDEKNILKKADVPAKFANELDVPYPFKKAMLVENQARFNPLKYVKELAHQLKQQGCEIFENTSVTSIEEKESSCILQTDHTSIVAKKVIMATHTPKGILHAQMLCAPYRSYVVAAKLKEKYPLGHYWDMDEPRFITSTHSLQSEQLDMLMVAGEHHKVGQSSDHLQCYQKIEEYIRSHYEVESLPYRWSAQHYQAADGLPYIGLSSHASKNIYMATGFYADGLVYGTLAGVILSDLISDAKNPWANYYKSLRWTLTASAPGFIKENTNNLLQYFKDLPLNVDIKDIKELKEIKPEAGKTIEIKGEKYGVYRDKQGKLHGVSIVCTHMKCILNWNNAEKTWDCPCHGSRFDVEGLVLEGPAYQNLKKISLKEDK